MDWQLYSYDSKLHKQETAHEILQIYKASLHDQNTLRSILSEYSILDYFGKSYYGQDEVSSHLISNLYGSDFELSSLTTDERQTSVDWDLICEINAHRVDEELGVSLMSTPTSSFPGLAFSTPLTTNCRRRNILQNSYGKRSSLDLPIDYLFKLKRFKWDPSLIQNIYLEGQSVENSVQRSPKKFQNQIPNDMKFLSSFGTIRYSKQYLSMLCPKRIKHQSIGILRDRFCHLYIGFKCNERFVSVTNCKIWIIRYGISSRMTPRNLLKTFNETDYD